MEKAYNEEKDLEGTQEKTAHTVNSQLLKFSTQKRNMGISRLLLKVLE